MTDSQKWIVWNRKRTACCGRSFTHVYPGDLLEIECPCGEWVVTPLGRRLDEARN